MCLGPFGAFWGCSEERCFYLLLHWTAHASGILLQHFRPKKRCICCKFIKTPKVNKFVFVSDKTFAFIYLVIARMVCNMQQGE